MNLPLINTTEKYTAATEREAYDFIDEQKKLSLTEGFELRKAICEKKEKKVKGEIVDEFYYVTLTKNYEF